MKENSSFKDFNNHVKDIDGKKGIVTGYFADFDTIDSDGDIIVKGAFDKTIKSQGPESNQPRIKHLINHNPYQPLGLLTVLKEDKKGLYYESKIGNHTLGKDFILMAEAGLITEHSIGYKTIKYAQLMPWEDWKDGEAMRELNELKLYEGSSLTAWGANPNTPLTGVKSSDLTAWINKAKQVEKFCSESKATDETIESLSLYNKSLLQTIAGLQTEQQGANEPKDVQETEIVIKRQTDTVDCPHCGRFTHNTMEEKSYIKCHRCNHVFIPGGFGLLI